MKKSLSLFLILVIIIGLTSCRGLYRFQSSSDFTFTVSADELPSVTESFVTSSDTSESSKITSYESFVEKIETEYKVTKTETEDGMVKIDISKPSDTVDQSTTVGPPNRPNIPDLAPEQPEPEAPSEIPSDEVSEDSDTLSDVSDTGDKEPSTDTSPYPTNALGFATYTTNQKHTNIPNTKRYLYSLLDDSRKAQYRKLDDAIKNLDARVNMGVDLTVNDNYFIYYYYMADNPEMFFISKQICIFNHNTYVLSYSDGGENTCYYGGIYPECNDTIRAAIRAKQAVFYKELENIISTIPNNAPQVEKEKLIWDVIVKKAEYNNDAQWDGIAEDNWTAYGVLVNGKGVCESYSEAFQALCFAVGINCAIMEDDHHEWNVVELDGSWYQVDVTYGDAGIWSIYEFFNNTTDFFSKTGHEMEQCNWEIPNCTATKYIYNNYFKKKR